MPARPLPTVLVVDHAASNRQLICDCLRQLNDIRVVGAGDGAQALHFFRELRPSLVFLDLALGDIDGISLARALRDVERREANEGITPWAPIVFLSPIQDEEALARGILAGGDDFLHTPLSEVVLLAKARAMLRIAGMQREIHDAHRQMSAAARLDGLTNIPNRRHFDETLSAEWKRCRRADAPLSVVLGDIDFFKQFNDIYGHPAGDSCLTAVAGSLHEALFRVEDMVARYGGEEFAAILPGTDGEGARAVAERMRRAARELCIPHARGVGGLVSCSFGIASIHPDADSLPQQLLQAADAGLYRAKRAGRNQIGQAAG